MWAGFWLVGYTEKYICKSFSTFDGIFLCFHGQKDFF
jgi:hypothetical protein